MMLQFNSLIIDSLTFQHEQAYLQGFTFIKVYLRKPCSFDFVTSVTKLIHKIIKKGTKHQRF